MNKIMELAGQHIRESESHLRHIDELMARARGAAVTTAAAAQREALLTRAQTDRDRLARELDEVRRLPVDNGSEVAKRGEGLNGMMATIGLELEKAVTAVLNIRW